MPELEPESEVFDPRSRRLCPDGTCIGVIGADGRCKACGLAARPGLAGEASGAARDLEREKEEDLATDDLDEPDAGLAAEPIGGSGFDPTRKLCVDGSCIGVIGPDGRCTECGQVAEA